MVDDQSAVSSNFSMQAFLQGKPKMYFLMKLCTSIFSITFSSLVKYIFDISA